jgi:16S rRNA (uracil1498-N3)-methyltransferase
VGPEGGFSNKEINLLMENGFKTISLGNTILRAETAAIYITSIFRYMMGE